MIIIGMVAVYRKCRSCGRLFKVGAPGRTVSGALKCFVCSRPVVVNATHGMTRSIAITDEGRRALREAGL